MSRSSLAPLVGSVLAVLMVIGFGHVPQAAAQVRPAMVRNVDEPARVPYYHSLAPACPFTNSCQASFPAVPAGKRLRVTSVGGLFYFTNVTGFFAVRNLGNVMMAFPVSPFSGAYYGNLISPNQQVDLYFEEGQAPVLEFGVSAGVGGIFSDARNRLTVSGYLVDVLP